MERFCQLNGLVYLDYYSAMADANGALRPELTKDGVHPNRAGYLIDGAVGREGGPKGA